MTNRMCDTRPNTAHQRQRGKREREKEREREREREHGADKDSGNEQRYLSKLELLVTKVLT